MAATKTKQKKTTADLAAEITDRIVAAMEDTGLPPWQRSWKVVGGTHKNCFSKRPYRGINQFLLDLTASVGGYSSPYWMTFNQAEKESYRQWRKEQGMTVTLDKDFKKSDEYKAYAKADAYKGVRKGEKGTTVYLFRPFTVEKRDKDKKPVLDKNGRKQFVTLFDVRYFKVWNSEQTDLTIETPEKLDEREHTPIESAKAIIDGYKDCPDIRHGGDSASYSPTFDHISMPKPEQFHSDEEYYHTLFHECVHSTGHESRTHRIKDWTGFGSDPYAKEELVAELGAAILSGTADITLPEMEQSEAAYIKHWIKRFKDDKTLLLYAGSKAQGAVDYILDTQFEGEDK